MNLKKGKYIGRIAEYGAGKPFKDAKRASVFVKFDISDPSTGETGSIIWFGSMEDKADPKWNKNPYENSIDSLVRMGLKGNDPYAIAENAPAMLNTFIDYELVVEDYQDREGKKKFKVKYINLPGSGGVKDALSHKEAKAMDGYNFTADVMAARQASGIKDEPVKQEAKTFPEIDF